ncbi:MAG: hypothetical protein JW809_00705 [Pirellulales bacterium]|nr:hypothetical protein [Pirellulales bacterium]
MTIRYTPRTIRHDEAERRRAWLRRDQARRDEVRRRTRRRAEFRANLIAGVQGALAVAALLSFFALACWLAVSGALPGVEVRWRE